MLLQAVLFIKMTEMVLISGLFVLHSRPYIHFIYLEKKKPQTVRNCSDIFRHKRSLRSCCWV